MSFALDIEGAHLAALRRVGEFAGRRVLEIGCGDGRLTKALALEAASVLAFDPNADAVESAARSLEAEVKQARVQLLVGSADVLQLPSASFDVALFSWSY